MIVVRSWIQRVAIVLLACHFQLLPGAARAETLTMGGVGWSLGVMRHMADAYTRRHPDVTIVIPPSVGSNGGIRTLLAGKFDASFSSRGLTAEEQAQGAVAIPLFKTPFVLAVSTEVRGDVGLTKEEVVRAFDLAIPSWPDGTPLRILFRPESEAANGALKQHFPGIATVLEEGRKRRGAIVLQTDQEAMTQGERVPGTIVPATLAGILGEGRALKPVAIDGVAPTVPALESGAYPMWMAMRVIVAPHTGEAARAFIEFSRSAEGRSILSRYGALPIDRLDE
ncbi:PstS family phosphate ABC transporter substrate-binding protein [Azospirillum sp.]|uniref:PstS family phosphate ABC transporter substrate-binding protein n=1 Tax=Azospirillum sp. TaxID=34012 RepID=UPI002D6C5104|nr:substrate-binding domain-containing protein [Azospirillum sp.]HYD71339.1 substrate-binding domain-containing protein [Azospirillum sp.]